MNAQEWNKLRKNWDSLLEVFPHDIISYLFQKSVITYNDKKTVEKEKIHSDRMDKLLSILKSKPPEMKAFDSLMSALEYQGTSELADKIKSTETTSDATLKFEVDPRLRNSEVRTVLLENFENKQGRTTKLSEIRAVLLQHGAFGGHEWTNKVLEDFVWKEFTGVTIDRIPVRKGKSVKKETQFKNIGKVKKTPSQTSTTVEQERGIRSPLGNSGQVSTGARSMLKIDEMSPIQSVDCLLAKTEEITSIQPVECLPTKMDEISPVQPMECLPLKTEEICAVQPVDCLPSKTEEISSVQPVERLPSKMEEISPVQPLECLPANMEEMSPTRLRDYLLPKMVQQKLPTDILDTLVKENITGSIFLTMTENDFKEIQPTATFGVKRFLSMHKGENTCHSSVKTYHEYLRTFDKAVKHTDKYIQLRCIDATINIRGRKTDPVRNFHLIQDEGTEESAEFIGSEVVPFVSACLNDRRNGTIYFGISPPFDEQFIPGEIIGVNVSKEDIQAEISHFLKKSFLESQQNLIANTVRDAKFVPVISDGSKIQELNLWVVEVDVVPSSFVMKDEIIRTKLKWLPIYSKKRKSKEPVVFRFSSDGLPEIISSDDLYNYEKEKEQIVQQRREEETAQKYVHSSPNLRSTLLNLLTGGGELLKDTIFPFLITSSIDTHMDMQYLSQNITFIKWLNPEVVFDFDPTGYTDGIYKNLDSVQEEVMRVLTTDNFDKERCSKEQYKTFIEGLAVENRISWVFCNGYEELNIDSVEPTEWNRKRRNAFQESLRYYKDNFDMDRIIVIICLFSKKYEVMMEACEEILTKFPDNWMLLADSRDTAKLWQKQILSRNKAERQALVDRCVIGMSWEEVNLTIKQALNKSDLQDVHLLPTSTGALVEVREKKLKDWCDIDVLSAGDFNIHENEREKKKKEVEEKFYRGEQASWLNFYFHDQVLKRDIHDELMRKVNDSLEGKVKDEEDKVTSVLILHQPGAGGTTSARQVLWDLRKIYRCCVLNNITDQTCDQLDEVRTYSDSSPKPILILIDNEDDDKCLTLIENLEERGRKYSRLAEVSFNVYCTVISCIRRASLPRQIKHPQVALRQELTKKELEWFREKNETLESRFKKDNERNVNPKFLISFNILRENFDKEYISKVVKEFSDDVKTDKEVKLLKIISLLNTYDPDFKPVQVSCLDKVLEQNTTQAQRWGTVRRNMKWEATLSQGIQVLLNLASNKNNSGRARSSLRVFNKNIAEEILTQMKDRTGQKESEMMLELLESGIFEQDNSDSKKFQNLINNVIKKREFKRDGKRKQKFSKFIFFVKRNEGAEVTVNILELLFELNHDPFTAQLISRFYIDMKNWSRAEHFAKRATGMLPSNSFLWDTYGQVYKNRLLDNISPGEFQDDNIHGVIELSEKCIEVFRKEQVLSEQEVTSTGNNNFAGYFGELRVTVLLLSALKMCPSFTKGDTLHKYLVDEHFKPGDLNFLNDQESNYVKSLEKSSKEAMRRLDEEYLQMKDSSNLLDVVSPQSDNDKRTLLDLKVNLDEYFGEANDFVPRNLAEPETCDYIRRRVKRLGATSLYRLLLLRQNSQGDLSKIYDLIMTNIKTRSCSFEDLKILLDTVTILLIDNHVPEDVKFEKILEWCRRLYSIEKPQSTDRWYLETYLYFVLYNFPTEERQHFKLCVISDLSNAIEKWQEAFKKNYPAHGKEKMKLKRETTLFFLGNGPPLHDIVHQDALREMDQYSRSDKWDVPALRKKLRMMSGSLSDQGEKVTINVTTREGNKINFSIQTSHRVTKRDMWQKKVYFYVGFSFSGPRAYGMSTQELGVTVTPAPKILSQTIVSSNRMKQQISPLILSSLYKDLATIHDQIKKSNRRNRSELESRKQRIESEIKKLLGE